MFDTIESTHKKLKEKIYGIKDIIADFSPTVQNILVFNKNVSLKNINLDQINAEIRSIESKYNLSVISILRSYYEELSSETKNTHEYYRIISCENFVANINNILLRLKNIVESMHHILKDCNVPRIQLKKIKDNLYALSQKIEKANAISINIKLERLQYEICKCGKRMMIVPELSELKCPSITCNKTKTIVGIMLRDENTYACDTQKSRNNGYDPSRHYRFWIERLQALEQKVFNPIDLEKIEYIIKRDSYNKRELTCGIIRIILQDSYVNATNLNEHAPLLVKMFGGRPPPQLNFEENRICSLRFNKAMKLYDIVNPKGGNKPYYPYFIYKIIENLFKNNPEKLRLLDYIHLQSRETVIKNDRFYEKMAAISDPEDGIVYSATDPCERL